MVNIKSLSLLVNAISNQLFFASIRHERYIDMKPVLTMKCSVYQRFNLYLHWIKMIHSTITSPTAGDTTCAHQSPPRHPGSRPGSQTNSAPWPDAAPDTGDIWGLKAVGIHHQTMTESWIIVVHVGRWLVLGSIIWLILLHWVHYCWLLMFKVGSSRLLS